MMSLLSQIPVILPLFFIKIVIIVSIIVITVISIIKIKIYILNVTPIMFLLVFLLAMYCLDVQ